MRSSIILVALSLVSAGCIGFGGGDELNQTSDSFPGPTDPQQNNTRSNQTGNGTDDRGNGTDSRGNETGNRTDDGFGNETGNGTDEGPMSTWQYDNRTGDVSGTALLVMAPSQEETWDVTNGTFTLVLNVSTEGGDLDVTVRPPGCESSDCEQDASTTDGNGSLTVQGPTEGTWTAELSAPGLGSKSVQYELVIAQEVPVNETAGF